MVALTAKYRLHIQTAIVDGRRALAEADRCGLPRAAIVAHQASAYALFESANWGAAEAECAAALGKARELGAIRFASISEHLLSEIYRLQGHKEAARSAASKAWEVSKATGPMFTGPTCLSAVMRNAPDESTWQQAYDEALRLLKCGCASHNYLRFHEAVMDEALERGQLDLVVQHAQMLKEYTAKQPLPWSDFYAERALALARVSADANCEQSQRELSVLVERAREFGVMRALPQC
jgi:hypothetical protein